MSINTFFSFCPKHWKNGTTWLGRSACWMITENKYDDMRVWKRTFYAEWWYLKQHWLHWLYVNKSEWANALALIPKPDSSHGFPYKETPSRYAQIAEDNFNSDGYVGWYTYLGVAGALFWNAYIYFWPRRHSNSYDFVAEENQDRLQYIDSFMSSNYDQSIMYWWNFAQLLLPPHTYENFRRNRHWHFAPDSKIQAITLTLNRRNTFCDHYWTGLGSGHEMH